MCDFAVELLLVKQVQCVAPLVRREPNPKTLAVFFIDTARRQIFSRDFGVIGLRVVKQLKVVVCDQFCGRQQSCFVFGAAGFGFLAARELFHRDTSLLGQYPQRSWKIDAVVSHHETENVATDITRPTFPSLSFTVDRQRRFFVSVPGTTSSQVASGRMQLQRRANDIDDIDGCTHSFF